MELYLIRVEMLEDTTLLLKIFSTYFKPAQPPRFHADAAFFFTILAQAIGDGYPTFESLPPLAHEVIEKSPAATHPQEAIGMYREMATSAAQHPLFESITLLKQHFPTPAEGEEPADFQFFIYDEENQTFGNAEDEMVWALFQIELTHPQWAHHLEEGKTWTTEYDFA